jgi:16S rRNA (cytidine1402-2'-O)-methyltransferase
MKKLVNQSKKYIQKRNNQISSFVLNKRTEVKEHQDFIKPLLEGKNGLMSEAGCPGVADPGL